jgi:methionyl-tRNA formyltransferase
MKFGFVTCVELGMACMREIYRIGGALDLAITLPDDFASNKSGRVCLDSFCREHAIPLCKGRSINDPAVIERIREAGIDWLFIIGWSQIAKAEVLAAPRLGALGMHPTLLPEGRGRAPIPWAILKGLDRTGVTLFRLDAGVDSGEIVEQIELPLAPNETATTLYQRVAAAHEELIARAWPKLLQGTCRFQPQDASKATIWPKRSPEDGALNREMDCVTADRLVRATTHPYPGAFFDTDGVRYRIWRGRAVPHASTQIPTESSPLVIGLRDGAYVALDWAKEERPRPS